MDKENLLNNQFKIENTDTINLLHKKYLKCYLIMFCGYSIPFIAYILDIKPNNEDIQVWVQRSGSLVVTCAIWVEFILLNISGYAKPNGIITTYQGYFKDMFNKIHTIATYIVSILALFGTLIWGYGDIILNQLLT